MLQGRFKMLCFLLRTVPLIQLMYSINHQFGANASQFDVFERMSKIEARNRQQGQEISVLKTRAIEDRDEISELRNRVAKLEAAPALTNITNQETIAGRPKRPFRLMAPQLPKSPRKKEKANVTEEKNAPEKIFYDPPTSCRELGTIGHTLNGYYLVKGEDESKSTNIQAVYCQFNQPQQGMNQGNRIESRIGIIDVKSSLVQFDVRFSGALHWFGGNKIKFFIQNLNVGNGFDWKNQWFVAPYPGTYFFSISGTKNRNSKDVRTCIAINLNGRNIGEAISSENTIYGGYSNQFTRKLNAMDKIELFLKFGGIPYSIYFTGWMLNEDLLIQ